jgi:hypothetical protein
VLAACGGGDNGSTLSTPQYIARVDAVCGPPSRGQGSAQIADFRARALARVRELDPPTELKDRVREFVALSRQQVTAQRQLAAAQASRQAIGIENAQLRLDQLTASRLRASTQIGFKRCGQPSSGAVTTAGYLAADVARQADAACETANRFTLAHPPRNASLTELGRGLAIIIPRQRQALAVLRSLQARANSSQFEQLNELIERRLDAADRALAAARAGDLRRYIEVNEQGERVYQRGLPLGWRLGLTVCGVASNLGV